MGNLLSYALTCDWVDVVPGPVRPEAEDQLIPCSEEAQFKAAQPGTGRQNEASALIAAADAGWIAREKRNTGSRGIPQDIWFCPLHAPMITASGL